MSNDMDYGGMDLDDVYNIIQTQTECLERIEELLKHLIKVVEND